MNTEEMKQVLEALEWDADYDTSVTLQKAAIAVLKKAIQEEALRNVQRIGHEIEQDWSTQEAALESLREHMARIKELEAQIERMKSEKPVAWMDSSGHPKHLRHIQNSEERRLYGELQPLYLHAQLKQEQGEPVAWISHNAGLYHFKPDESLNPLPLYLHPQPVTTCSGCGESSTKDGFLATYCLKCCEMASGKQTTHHWYDTGYDTGYVDGQVASGKPLTDEHIRKASLEAGMQEHYMDFHSGFVRFARAIEAAHGIKEKNT
jgi:hypothetical protein